MCRHGREERGLQWLGKFNDYWNFPTQPSLCFTKMVWKRETMQGEAVLSVKIPGWYPVRGQEWPVNNSNNQPRYAEEHWGTDLNWGKWWLQLFACCFGFSCAVLHELSMHSWCHFSMLFRMPILGRCTNTPSFLHFYIKVLKILVLNRYQVNTGPTTKPIPTLVTCQGSRPYKWGDQWVMTYEMNHH